MTLQKLRQTKQQSLMYISATVIMLLTILIIQITTFTIQKAS